MFHHPYLETCCRSALHRLLLCGESGRPAGLKDGPCLLRLASLGLAQQRPDGRFEIAEDGRRRHDELVSPAHQPPARPEPARLEPGRTQPLRV